MGIRFELGDDEGGAVASAYSPLLEAVLSLHVLVEPKHHALQHRWVRAMRSLSPPVRREIAALSFLYRWTLRLRTADVTAGYDGFASELERLGRMRTDVIAFDLLRPVYDHGGIARPSRKRILALRRATPPQLVSLLKALADPTRLRILELVAKQPRSTQELAPLGGLSAAGASKQLRLLARAGLLTTKRDGYYVVYSLDPERLSTISDDLRSLTSGE